LTTRIQLMERPFFVNYNILYHNDLGWRAFAHGDLDIEGDAASIFGVLPISCDDLPIGSSVYLIHQGSGNPMTFDTGTVSELHQPGSCDGNFPSGFDAEYGYQLIGQGGASGAPVFSASTNAVAGLHHCGSCSDYGLGIPIALILSAAMPHIRAHGASVNGSDTLTAPTSVRATDGAYCDRTMVSWDEVSGAEAYAVFRSILGAGCAGAPISTSEIAEFNDTTATPGLGYRYSVKSISECGDSECSATDEGFRSIGAEPECTMGPSEVAAFVGCMKGSGVATPACPGYDLDGDLDVDLLDFAQFQVFFGAP